MSTFTEPAPSGAGGAESPFAEQAGIDVGSGEFAQGVYGDLMDEVYLDELEEELGLPGDDEEALSESWFEGEDVSSTPRRMGAPFAHEPPPGSHFPVKSSHPRGAEINYVTASGQAVGRNAGRRFAARRGNGARRHCAIDLYARAGDEVVACQDGRIVAFYGFCCGKQKTTNALFVDHGSVVINYGEVDPDSLRRLGLKKGDTVSAGQTIAFIGVNPGGSSMLHFETYEPGTTRNKRWRSGRPAPDGLFDPTTYLLGLTADRPPAPSRPSTPPSPPATPPSRRPTLRRGSRGNDVRALQRALTAAGFPSSADGVFGRRTQASVRAFQSARGLAVDGVVGPNTWGALGSTGTGATAGATAGASGPPVAVGTPNIALGRLIVDAPGRDPFSYQFTSEDLIWTAKLMVHEAGGEENADNAAVLWAMFNRYALFTHRHYPTFTAFIRRYSTTLQPVLANRRAAERHYRKGDSVYRRTGGFYEGTSIPKGQLVRHLRIQAAPWSDVKASARRLATRALRGELPNPGIGLASEFGSTRIYYRQRHGRNPNRREWLEYTRAFARRKNWAFVDVPGIDPMKNAFFVQRRVADLPADAVRVLPPAGAGEHEDEWEGRAFEYLDDVEPFDEDEAYALDGEDELEPGPSASSPFADVDEWSTEAAPAGEVDDEHDELGFYADDGGSVEFLDETWHDGEVPFDDEWDVLASDDEFVDAWETEAGELTSSRFAGNADLVAVAEGSLLLARRGDARSTPVRSGGAAVRLVQLALVDLGYPLPRFGADGDYGRETKAAVKRYQTDRSAGPDALAVDGIVGSRTLLRLDGDIATFEVGGGRTPLPTPVPAPLSATALYWKGVLRIGLPGNTVEPLIDGPATFAAMKRAIESAQGDTHFVYLAAWWCDPWVNLAGPGTSLLDLFAQAGARGVQVRVLLWEPSSLVYRNHARLHEAAVEAINRIPNCHAQEDSPPELAKSHHQKLMVVRGSEGLVALTGGVDVNADRLHSLPPPPSAYRADRPSNIGWVGGSGGSGSGSAGGGGEPLHDVHSLLSGPTALPLLRAFLRRWWARSGDRAIDRSAPLRGTYRDPLPAPTGDQFVRIGETFNGVLQLPTGNVPSRKVDAQDIWLRSILGARKFIYMEEQYLTHPCAAEAINKVLPQLDHVIIVIPPSELTDLPSRWRRRQEFLGIAAAGRHGSKVRVYTRAVDPTDACRRTGGRHLYIHSKAAVIDDELLLVGSANCNHRGWETDSELVIATFDQEDQLVSTAKQARMALWAEHLGVRPSEVADAVATSDLWETAPTRNVCRYDPTGGRDDTTDHLKPDSIVDPEDSQPTDPCRVLL